MLPVEMTVSKNLGYFLIGEPGSGKTTGAIYVANSIIAQELSSKAIDDLIDPTGAMCIAMDKHHSSTWDEMGILCIDEPMAIYEQFKLLKSEYDKRKPGTKVNRLIIFFDEIAETLDAIKTLVDEKEGKRGAGKAAVEFIQNTYRSFGTGGRKKYINFIGMNHSYNVAALGIDGYYRTCFVSLLFNDALRHYVQTSNKMMSEAKRKDLYRWACEVMDNKYICLATGAIGDKKIRHPTHHDYSEVKDGNRPMNLQQIKQLPLSIKVVDSFKVKVNGSFGGARLSDGTDFKQVDGRIELAESTILQPNNEDLVRLERIHEFWAKGERRLKVIIPAVWCDVAGVEVIDSRAFKKARSEFRRLTGK